MTICLVTIAAGTAGCLHDGSEDPAGTATSKPPAPVRALSEADATKVTLRYARLMNAANRRLDSLRMAEAETGSALQMRSAQYRIFRASKLKFRPLRYTSMLAATPAVTGYPRWFFAALTDRGSRPVSRDVPVFVQDREGGPWRAAYVPLADRATGALGKGIDVEDVPEVVPPDDPGLVLPPGRLAAAHADVVSRGKRSPGTRLFQLTRPLTERYRGVVASRKVLVTTKWKGYYRPGASTHPVYAVRTKSRGALVWYAVDFLTKGRKLPSGRNLIWTTESWGDIHKAFVGKSRITAWFSGVEREEILAYVPPKGGGKIRILAHRWSPVTLKGR